LVFRVLAGLGHNLHTGDNIITWQRSELSGGSRLEESCAILIRYSTRSTAAPHLRNQRLAYLIWRLVQPMCQAPTAYRSYRLSGPAGPWLQSPGPPPPMAAAGQSPGRARVFCTDNIGDFQNESLQKPDAEQTFGRATGLPICRSMQAQDACLVHHQL
jgi:hypothetical protein